MIHEHILEVLRFGTGAGDVALATGRIAVGSFFAISGYHKLFNPARHASLREQLVAAKIPAVRFNEWFVPGTELVAGTALAVGLFAPASALLLGAICAVACITVAIREIPEKFAPIDKADFLDDILYLPEILYGVILLAIIAGGPGALAIDNLLR